MTDQMVIFVSELSLTLTIALLRWPPFLQINMFIIRKYLFLLYSE